MAYSTGNPPIRMAVGTPTTQGTTLLTGNNRQWWSYVSTNLSTDLVAANFFQNGGTLGMKPGDLVMGCQYTSAGSSVITFTAAVSSVSSTGGASMTTGSLMTSTFN